MLQTPDLFDYPHHAGWKEPSTSRDAALAIEGDGVAAKIRTRCLYAIEDSIFGLSADECAEKIGASILSVRPRIAELKARGLVKQTGIRRVNASGMKANVWVAA